MSDDWDDLSEYRVYASITLPSRESDPGNSAPVAVLHTEWNRNLSYVARMAEDLTELGFSTSVERRQRSETVEYEQYAGGLSEVRDDE